ncbi:MAG: fasciclin domain-containing protein [Cyanobacteria bacterium J06626_6]
MQANTTSRFIKNVMLGLVASSAGAFVALPGAAMPGPSETGAAVEAPVEAIDSVPAPVAEEALPVPAEAEAVEADAVDTDVVTEADALEEEPVAEEAMAEEEPIAEEAMAEEEPVAEEAMAEEEPIAEEAMVEEEPVAETEAAPVDAETVEAADIEALDEEAIEASDTMDGEPMVEEPMVEEPMVEEPMVEEPTVDETPVAEEDMPEEAPVVEEPAAEEEPVAEEEATEPVAEGEEINTEDFTIAELTDSSDSFNTLAAALAAADLTEILGGEGPYTVFAPTDEAFEALPEGAVDQLLLPENKDVLVQVLTYHVVPGAIMSADLEPGEVATVEGSELTVDITDTVTVNNANVVLADVEASNGVIHIIDRVIIPPSPEADASSEEIAIQDADSVETE